MWSFFIGLLIDCLIEWLILMESQTVQDDFMPRDYGTAFIVALFIVTISYEVFV